MYVTRFDTWGFEKNCTEKRVSSLLHQKRDGDSTGATSKLRRTGKVVNGQRIERYLKRKNKDLKMSSATDKEEIATTDVKRSPHALTLANSQSPDTGSTPTYSQHSPSVQPYTFGEYEPNCLFRQWDNR